MARSVLPRAFLACLAIASHLAAAEDEILIAGNFRVEIPGVDGSHRIVSFDADPVEIDMLDDPQNADPDWRAYRPGLPRFGQARFSFRTADAQLNQDLETWTNQMPGNGDRARRTISIVLLDREGKEVRRYSLHDSWPVALSPSGSRRLTNVPCAGCQRIETLSELTVQIGSIEISTPASGGSTGQDQGLRYKGFNVEIEGVKGAPAETDSSWSRVDGGAPQVDTIEATLGQDGSRHYKPGKAYVSELKLTGYMTPSRKALLSWMQNSAKGTGDLRRSVVIRVAGPQPNDPPTEHQYIDCLITRIEIPSLNSGSSDPVKETVVLRPTRYNDPA